MLLWRQPASAAISEELVSAAGLSPEKLSHEEVLEVGKKAAGDFARLLQAVFSA
jgi:purine nucleoside phosphorylase